MNKIKNIYDKFEEIVLATSLAFTVILIFIQIVMRYVFNNSLSWSEELARYIFTWQCWLGISLAYRKNAHISVEILPDKLNLRARNILNLIIFIMILVFNFLLFRWGMTYSMQMKASGNIATATRIPLWIVYFSLPFSCIIVCFRIIGKIIESINVIKMSEDELR